MHSQHENKTCAAGSFIQAYSLSTIASIMKTRSNSPFHKSAPIQRNTTTTTRSQPSQKNLQEIFRRKETFLLSGMEGSNLEYFINNFWNVICKLAPKQHCNACPPPPRGSHSPKHVFLQHHKCSAQLCCTTIQHQQLYKGREEEGLGTAACLGPL